MNQIFVVHREDQEKPNMEFNMHESGINCYSPTDHSVVIINTVCRNKQVFSKIKNNRADQKHFVLQTWVSIS